MTIVEDFKNHLENILKNIEITKDNYYERSCYWHKEMYDKLSSMQHQLPPDQLKSIELIIPCYEAKFIKKIEAVFPEIKSSNP